jgi:translation initiation factor RLI1
MIKSAPNVLLLDEPSNDLDVEVLRSLENAIAEFSGSAAIVSHDRWFLDRLCTHILAFEGDSNVVFFTGNYTDYENDREARLGMRQWWWWYVWMISLTVACGRYSLRSQANQVQIIQDLVIIDRCIAIK